MSDLSLLRLYVLRATYALLAVGLAATVWPHIVDHSANVEHMRGAAWALLGAIGLLALLGIRHPVRMLPLILFELTWKVIWIVAFGMPLWLAGTLEGPWRDTWVECWFGVVVCVVAIPWPYTLRNYVIQKGDPWT